MTPGERAWIVLGAGVVGWNLCAREGQMLSEIADKRPWVARGIGLIVYLHVANILPERWDVIHVAFNLAHNGTHGRRTLA